jgi:ABC-2 type transport system permease protein
VLTLLNPLRHFTEVVRAIFLKGTGVAFLWPQLGWLLALGLSMMAVAVARFRKTLG